MNSQKIINKDKIISYSVWAVLFSAYPFMFYNILQISSSILTAITSLILLAVCIYFKCKSANKLILYSILILFLFWGIQITYRSDGAYFSNIIQNTVLCIIFYAIYNMKDRSSFYKSYVKLMCLMVICGTFVFFILLIFRIPPILEYVNHNGKAGYCWILTCTNTLFELGDKQLIRYSGLFDEPGTLCFYSLYALLINKITLRNKKIEYILLILPLFTFSLAHIIMVILYVVLFKIHNIRQIIWLSLIILLSFIYLYSYKDSPNDRIYSLTLGRFEMSDNGELQGDNRTSLFKSAIQHFSDAPFLGKGKTFFVENEEYVDANIAAIGAKYGIIGYIVLFCLFHISIFKSIIYNRKIHLDYLLIKSNIILGVTYLQRPDVLNIMQSTSLLLFVLAIIDYQNKVYERKYII